MAGWKFRERWGPTVRMEHDYTRQCTMASFTKSIDIFLVFECAPNSGRKEIQSLRASLAKKGELKFRPYMTRGEMRRTRSGCQVGRWPASLVEHLAKRARYIVPRQ